MILAELKFKKDLVSYVYFAEQHGGLAHTLTEGSDMVLKREADYQRLKRLAAYPIFLVLLTFILFFFVNRILLPKFNSLFTDMNLAPNIFMETIAAAAHIIPFTLYFLLSLTTVLSLYYIVSFKNLHPLKQKKEACEAAVCWQIYQAFLLTLFLGSAKLFVFWRPFSAVCFEGVRAKSP